MNIRSATKTRPPTAPPAIVAFLLLSSWAAARVIAKILMLGAGVWLGVVLDERLGLVVDETDGLELILIVGV